MLKLLFVWALVSTCVHAHNLPSVDAAVSIVLASGVSKGAPDVVTLATGAVDPDSVVVVSALVVVDWLPEIKLQL